jgi:hypothetical protein
MPQAFSTITTAVRRRGGVDRVREEFSEKCTPESDYSGDRRSRQIGKRHWVRKSDNGYCSSGSYWHNITRRDPGKGEEKVRTHSGDCF